MRLIFAAIAVAAPLLCAPSALYAAPTGSQQTVAQGGSHVTVNGERRICRRFERTNSRMRVGRVCRSASEWRANGVDIREHSTIEDMANSLDTSGGHLSTGDVGGSTSRFGDISGTDSPNH
jgi:hypothetical protein